MIYVYIVIGILAILFLIAFCGFGSRADNGIKFLDEYERGIDDDTTRFYNE